LGVHSLAELDEGGAVEPDPRDIAADRLLDDRGRRRAEGRALRQAEEGVELGVEVEALLGADEVVDEPGGETARSQPDRLVGVAVDDVVAPRGATDPAGLAAALVVPGLRL